MVVMDMLGWGRDVENFGFYEIEFNYPTWREPDAAAPGASQWRVSADDDDPAQFFA
jgi:hypothetical protein